MSAKTGGTTAQYVYNGEGLRVQKTVDGETTLYLYEYDKVVLELDLNGSVKARNIYGLIYWHILLTVRNNTTCTTVTLT